MSFPAKSYHFLRTLGPSPADQIHHFQLDELKYELLVSRHVCSIPSPTCLYIHPQLRNSPPSTSSSITTGNPWHAKGQWTLGQILTTWVSIRFKDPLSWCWWLHCQDWDSYPVGNNHVNRLECKYASDTLRSYSLRSHVAKKQRNALCIRVFIPLNLHYQDFSSQSLHSQLQTITSELCILISNSNFNQPTNLQTKLLKSWHGAYFHDLQVSRRLCAGSPWTPKSLPFPQLSGCQWPHPHFDAQGTLLFGTRRRHLSWRRLAWCVGEGCFFSVPRNWLSTKQNSSKPCLPEAPVSTRCRPMKNLISPFSHHSETSFIEPAAG